MSSGTTSKVALELGRNSVGYEINKDFLPIIEEKIGKDKKELFFKDDKIEIIFQKNKNEDIPVSGKIKKNDYAILNNRINHPEYWKQLKNVEN